MDNITKHDLELMDIEIKKLKERNNKLEERNIKLEENNSKLENSCQSLNIRVQKAVKRRNEIRTNR
jgi:cell division protein FtsB